MCVKDVLTTLKENFKKKLINKEKGLQPVVKELLIEEKQVGITDCQLYIYERCLELWVTPKEKFKKKLKNKEKGF